MSISKSYILSLLEKNMRLDGRKLDEYRKPIKVEVGVSKHAEGSARVIIGETEVIAGVKIDVGEPYPDSPDEGVLITGTELLPLSSPEFELGPPDAQATELARVVDRGIRESKCIDMKKLCIKKGEKVWILFVDIYTINDAGNLIDAAALAALAALKETKFPEYDEKKEAVIFDKHTKKNLPLSKLPIACTLVKIGNKILVDVGIDEEKVLDARLTITTTEKGDIHAMQKGGDKTITSEDVEKMIDLAIEKGKELRRFL